MVAMALLSLAATGWFWSSTNEKAAPSLNIDQLAREYFYLWDAHDPPRLKKLFAEDATLPACGGSCAATQHFTFHCTSYQTSLETAVAPKITQARSRTPSPP